MFTLLAITLANNSSLFQRASISPQINICNNSMRLNHVINCQAIGCIAPPKELDNRFCHQASYKPASAAYLHFYGNI